MDRSPSRIEPRVHLPSFFLLPIGHGHTSCRHGEIGVWRLGLLAAALSLGSLAASAPSPGRARAAPVEGWVFFSTNTRSGLSFEQSLHRLGSSSRTTASGSCPG